MLHAIERVAGRVMAIEADVVNVDQVSAKAAAAMAAAAVAAVGSVAILINNAGGAKRHGLPDTSNRRPGSNTRRVRGIVLGTAPSPCPVLPFGVRSGYLLAVKASRIGPGIRPRSLTV